LLAEPEKPRATAWITAHARAVTVGAYVPGFEASRRDLPGTPSEAVHDEAVVLVGGSALEPQGPRRLAAHDDVAQPVLLGQLPQPLLVELVVAPKVPPAAHLPARHVAQPLVPFDELTRH